MPKTDLAVLCFSQNYSQKPSGFHGGKVQGKHPFLGQNLDF
jgi:hypothetical protein